MTEFPHWSNTRKRRHEGGTPFGEWMRCQPEIDSRRYHLDLEDFDYVWFDYEQGKLMLLEEKQKFASPTDPQLDTFGVLDQALRRAFSDPSFRVTRYYAGRTPHITYHGYHILQFEYTSPDDGAIRIDGVPVTREQLISFLRFEWSPVIKVYMQQSEYITASQTLQQLNHAVQYIRSTVYESHPETELLRKMYDEKLEQLRHIKALFPDVPKSQDLDDIG